MSIVWCLTRKGMKNLEEDRIDDDEKMGDRTKWAIESMMKWVNKLMMKWLIKFGLMKQQLQLKVAVSSSNDG